MSNKTILALGADIKNKFLISTVKAMHYGPDIGDLSLPTNFKKFKSSLLHTLKKNRIEPSILACDRHPQYFSYLFARDNLSHIYPQAQLITIQHHHAHIASVLHEHNIKRPVIGVSFDGTGYGSDGNMWGGEFMLVDQTGYTRLAHLSYRMMPGGDKVVYEPWRLVVSILQEKGLPFLPSIKKCDKQIVLSMITKNINTPLTSSAGRLFDAAAALLGICTRASFEAEGPIKLEKLSDPTVTASYPFCIRRNNQSYIIETDAVFLGMIKDIKRKVSKRIIAAKFHNSMARIIIDTVAKLARIYKIKHIALSGGVFQNRFLTSRVITQLQRNKFIPLTNKTSVTDTNISSGQYYVSSHSGKN
ncbi:MAG: hypothetical protein ABII23_09040 [bacterium]